MRVHKHTHTPSGTRDARDTALCELVYVYAFYAARGCMYDCVCMRAQRRLSLSLSFFLPLPEASPRSG